MLKLLKSSRRRYGNHDLLNYENKGQFGEYSIDHVVSTNLDGYFSHSWNIYVPSGNKTSEIDLIMVPRKDLCIRKQKLQRLDLAVRPLQNDAIVGLTVKRISFTIQL